MDYNPEKSDYLLTSCGGDGTIHLVLNAYIKYKQINQSINQDFNQSGSFALSGAGGAFWS